MSAFEEGYSACWHDRARDTNPYLPDDPKHSEWDDGWDTAFEEEEAYLENMANLEEG